MLTPATLEKAKVKKFLQDFRTKAGDAYEIPEHGSLGLLALGDIGLIAWRHRKKLSTVAK